MQSFILCAFFKNVNFLCWEYFLLFWTHFSVVSSAFASPHPISSRQAKQGLGFLPVNTFKYLWTLIKSWLSSFHRYLACTTRAFDLNALVVPLIIWVQCSDPLGDNSSSVTCSIPAGLWRSRSQRVHSWWLFFSFFP